MWRALSDGPEKRIAPDGVMDLMWFQDRLVVAGPDTRTVIVPTQAGKVTWGLQLAPGVAYALLGVPAHELAERRVELSDLVVLPRHDQPGRQDHVDGLQRFDRGTGSAGGRVQSDVEAEAGRGLFGLLDARQDLLGVWQEDLPVQAQPARSLGRSAPGA
ncbi:DUF6597 domain-containing transcriptional factor [Streptomyces sp. WZ-12]|uniref:DUF6597 domain-containing transcriptional factor n=1 Tax=Streptomyces sp. WZ-12 TaxID=3030210 RepID=UPI00315828F6